MTTARTRAKPGSSVMRKSPPARRARPELPRSARVRSEGSGRSDLDALDLLFKGFADPTRVRILSTLAAGPLCVSDIVEILVLPQPLVSRHLAYLRRTGLVAVSREGKYVRYRLAEATSPVHRSLIDCVRSCLTGVPSLDRERGAAAERVGETADEPC